MITKAANMDLRKQPFFLQDGDIIGVRFGKDDPEKQDDFQTDEDLINKANFNMMKEQQRKELAEAKRRQNQKKGADEHSLHIVLD